RLITKKKTAAEAQSPGEEKESALRLCASAAELEGLCTPEKVEEVTFATEREWRVHRLLSAIRQNTLVAHVEGLASPEAYLRNDLPVSKEDEALVESCDWEFLPAQRVFPKNQGGMDRLRELCGAGMAWRYASNPPWERLNHELDVIGKLGYADYFVVVHDIVRYSRERWL